MSPNEEPLRPTRVIASRVKELRKRQGLTAAQLAEHMTATGFKWDRFTVQNLESGRRASLTVDEFLSLAYLLSVAPVHLLVPTDVEEVAPYQLIPNGPRFGPWMVRAWLRGQTPIGKVDARRYFSEVPEDEWSPPAGTWTPEMIERQSRAVGNG